MITLFYVRLSPNYLLFRKLMEVSIGNQTRFAQVYSPANAIKRFGH